jgi:D-glycero-alpha-D-manno-heptose-7-phosphate kinase
LKEFIHVPFRFETSGSQIIFYDPEQDFALLDSTRDRHQMQEFRELDSLTP